PHYFSVIYGKKIPFFFIAIKLFQKKLHLLLTCFFIRDILTKVLYLQVSVKKRADCLSKHI
ncbi:MAG: hypothetical protein ACLTAP_02695, partial [Enterococcus faecium]